MADSDKNIVITPQTGVSGTSTTPKITFTGQSNTDIDLFINNSGDLVFQGTTGNLFTVTDNVDGTLFQVNDVSGITLADIVDTGLIRLGLNVEGTQVLIGLDSVTSTGVLGDTDDALQVDGNSWFNGDVKVQQNFVLSPVSSPLTGSSDGTPGQIAVDENYIYVCYDVNSWKRVSLTNF